MAQYWVVGGEYTDTYFHEALDGSEEWIGPFIDYNPILSHCVRVFFLS